ncbi:MAG: hypothetical protein ABSD48_12570 [Armatimonadota bacterium]|jgi:hypothetical protein
METSLALIGEERPKRGLGRTEAADSLTGILAGQLSEHTRRASRHDASHLLLFLQGGQFPSGLS